MSEQQRINTLNEDLAAFIKGLQAAQPTTEQMAQNLSDFSAQIREKLPSMASVQKGLESFEALCRKPQP